MKKELDQFCGVRSFLLCLVKIGQLFLSLLLNRFKRLREVVNNVVDVLRADAQSDGRWRDVLLRQFFRRHLRVSSGVGVNHKTLHVVQASSWPPLISKVKMLPAPFGKYFS